MLPEAGAPRYVILYKKNPAIRSTRVLYNNNNNNTVPSNDW